MECISEYFGESEEFRNLVRKKRALFLQWWATLQAAYPQLEATQFIVGFVSRTGIAQTPMFQNGLYRSHRDTNLLDLTPEETKFF